ncbi:haloacid dehalogenase hydrolase [Trypanosoma rangeli SC58]|uniref:Haloacid dehalogenase hydrolase n=1 Tax=Trypanosoma rangeli SC58 TaxID=429131 RepID=A0A061JD96_TRYRA|nr:haloacid dehalogenase hydrolase [Trypanosoma rangeli SC58]
MEKATTLMPAVFMRNECDSSTPPGDKCRSKFAGGAFAVVASDMDGTILDPNCRLTERTKDTLYELSTCGVHIILVTGRTHLAVEDTRRDLLQHYMKRHEARGACSSLSGGYEGIYVVSFDGARVQNPKGDMIFSRNLDDDIVRALYEHFGLRDHGDDPKQVVSVIAHQTGRFCLYRPFMSDAQMLENFVVLPEVHSDLLGTFPTTAVAKVSFLCTDQEILRRYENEINKLFHGRAVAVLVSETCLDVVAAGVSKATAIREIGKILNFDLERDVIAFGDSMSDMEMLDSVAKGCIMGNGQQRLGALLPHMEVVGSNSDDGVARKLMEVFFSLGFRLTPHRGWGEQ